MSLRDFEKDMAKAIKKIEKASEKTIRATALEFFSKIVMRTPVGNPTLWESQYAPPGYVGGRLRANWQASINTPISSTIEGTDPSGSVAISSISNTISSFKLGQTAYMANNLPYSEVVENGSSKQAPSGMVKITEREFEPLLEAYARRNKV